MESIQFIVTLVIILVIFYIANSLSKKQEKELKKMQSEIKKDDKIITYSGLSGIVSEVIDDRIIVKLYPNMIEVSIEKWAIAGLDDRKIEANQQKKEEDKNKTKQAKNNKENEKK